MNAEKVPAFWKSHGWYTSSISKILNNRAVLGQFQPCETIAGKRKAVGDVIPNYYPAIIDEDLFYRAQDSRKQRLTSNHQRGGGRKSPNLFAGVAKCAYCKGSMMYEDKGSGGRSSYLVCSNARRGRRDICRVSTSWLYKDLEGAFLKYFETLDLASVINADEHEKGRAIVINEIESSKEKISSLKQKREATYELVTKAPSDFLAGGCPA